VITGCVILNANDMSIAPPGGAMSAYLSRLYSGKTYRLVLRDAAKQLYWKASSKGACGSWPNRAENITAASWSARLLTACSRNLASICRPDDGHNLDSTCCPCSRKVRDHGGDRSILVHVVTQKGKGYGPDEGLRGRTSITRVVKVRAVATARRPRPAERSRLSETCSAQRIVKEAKKDGQVPSAYAAIPSGNGIDIFARRFPSAHI